VEPNNHLSIVEKNIPGNGQQHGIPTLLMSDEL
jgi:hypothetical protein